MATVSADQGFPSLIDVVKGKDPDGATAKVVEALTRFNPVLTDAVWQEGNLETGHRFTSRTALPSVGWRRFNEGVAVSKSGKDQVDEPCGMLEGNSFVDKALAKLGGNPAAFRATEDMAFIQALNNEVEIGMFYHSTKTAPEKFMGLSPRLDSTTNPYASQIIKCDAGAAGADQNSMWLVGWGLDTVFAMYPKGSTGGIEWTDMGEQILDPNGDGKKLIVYATNWSWKVGLCVKDARYLVRICNIDTSAFDPTSTAIITAMVKAFHQVFNPNGARFAWYVNRKVGTYLHLQALSGAKYMLTIDNVAGKPVMSLLGIPIRITDALNSTESVLV